MNQPTPLLFKQAQMVAYAHKYREEIPGVKEKMHELIVKYVTERQRLFDEQGKIKAECAQEFIAELLAHEVMFMEAARLMVEAEDKYQYRN